MHVKNYSNSKSNTSWQNVSKWYSKLVDDSGHYYHKEIIIPKTLNLMNLKPGSSVLDMACGQGILERNIPQNIYYQGIDAAGNLIKFATEKRITSNHHFQAADITKPVPVSKFDFSHAVIILAIQNIADPKKVFANINKHLVKSGKLIIVMNHPYFRIPKNSSWGIDKKNNLQYRRIDRYLSGFKIPILINPGLRDKSPEIISFHHPLSAYSQMLSQTGFMIADIEEWISNKVSVGKNAVMENTARREFPLFMAIVAYKN